MSAAVICSSPNKAYAHTLSCSAPAPLGAAERPLSRGGACAGLTISISDVLQLVWLKKKFVFFINDDDEDGFASTHSKNPDTVSR